MTAREWNVMLPNFAPVTLNKRGHWSKSAGAIRAWRHGTAVFMRTAGLPHLDRVHVTLHVSPPDNRRRDRDNLVGTLKPVVDGMRDAGVIDDDGADTVDGSLPVIHDADHEGSRARWLWWIVVREQEAAA